MPLPQQQFALVTGDNTFPLKMIGFVPIMGFVLANESYYTLTTRWQGRDTVIEPWSMAEIPHDPTGINSAQMTCVASSVNPISTSPLSSFVTLTVYLPGDVMPKGLPIGLTQKLAVTNPGTFQQNGGVVGAQVYHFQVPAGAESVIIAFTVTSQNQIWGLTGDQSNISYGNILGLPSPHPVPNGGGPQTFIMPLVGLDTSVTLTLDTSASPGQCKGFIGTTPYPAAVQAIDTGVFPVTPGSGAVFPISGAISGDKSLVPTNLVAGAVAVNNSRANIIGGVLGQRVRVWSAHLFVTVWAAGANMYLEEDNVNNAKTIFSVAGVGSMGDWNGHGAPWTNTGNGINVTSSGNMTINYAVEYSQF